MGNGGCMERWMDGSTGVGMTRKMGQKHATQWRCYINVWTQTVFTRRTERGSEGRRDHWKRMEIWNLRLRWCKDRIVFNKIMSGSLKTGINSRVCKLSYTKCIKCCLVTSGNLLYLWLRGLPMPSVRQFRWLLWWCKRRHLFASPPLWSACVLGLWT